MQFIVTMGLTLHHSYSYHFVKVLMLNFCLAVHTTTVGILLKELCASSRISCTNAPTLKPTGDWVYWSTSALH